MAQDEKVFLNLAGEFAVASELNRRKCLASVTYGASKSADVFALSRDFERVTRIEVKATDKEKWPIGQKAIDPSGARSRVIWVFVMFPLPSCGALRDESDRGAHAPRFFVLTAAELYQVWKKGAEKYRAAYKLRHGRAFDESRGVPTVSLAAIAPFEGEWSKILDAVMSEQS